MGSGGGRLRTAWAQAVVKSESAFPVDPTDLKTAMTDISLPLPRTKLAYLSSDGPSYRQPGGTPKETSPRLCTWAAVTVTQQQTALKARATRDIIGSLNWWTLPRWRHVGLGRNLDPAGTREPFRARCVWYRDEEGHWCRSALIASPR